MRENRRPRPAGKPAGLGGQAHRRNPWILPSASNAVTLPSGIRTRINISCGRASSAVSEIVTSMPSKARRSAAAMYPPLTNSRSDTVGGRGCPRAVRSRENAPANVAPATCFLQNLRPLGSIEAMLSRSPISIFHLLAQTAQLNDSMPQVGQVRRVIFLHFGPRVANTLRQARWTPDSEMNPRRNPASPARSCSARLQAYNQARAAPNLRRSRAAW